MHVGSSLSALLITKLFQLIHGQAFYMITTGERKT